MADADPEFFVGWGADVVFGAPRPDRDGAIGITLQENDGCFRCGHWPELPRYIVEGRAWYGFGWVSSRDTGTPPQLRRRVAGNPATLGLDDVTVTAGPVLCGIHEPYG